MVLTVRAEQLEWYRPLSVAAVWGKVKSGKKGFPPRAA